MKRILGKIEGAEIMIFFVRFLEHPLTLFTPTARIVEIAGVSNIDANVEAKTVVVTHSDGVSKDLMLEKLLKVSGCCWGESKESFIHYSLLNICSNRTILVLHIPPLIPVVIGQRKVCCFGFIKSLCLMIDRGGFGTNGVKMVFVESMIDNRQLVRVMLLPEHVHMLIEETLLEHYSCRFIIAQKEYQFYLLQYDTLFG